MNIDNTKEVSTRTLWVLFSIAAISFIFTLNLSHIGEEGVYTISSFEMWYNKHYLYPLIYGGNYGRPPFLNWLIIAVTQIVGWSHILLASRLVTAAATIATGLALAWLVKNIFYDKRFAAFAALAYLTTDALFYHGWLAYSDPVFAFCIFVAIACLWVSCERGSLWLLSVAIAALIAAFLTKALTAYAFYFSAVLVLLFLGKRKFLLHPGSILLHLIALSAPLLWAIVTNNANGSGLISDVVYWGWRNGQNTPIMVYLFHLIVFPVEIFVRILPISILAAYYFWRGYYKPEEGHKIVVKFLILFIGISFLPYWFTAKHASRYILPLYPFIALWCSYIVWHTKPRSVRCALWWFVAAIVIKYITVIFLWPYYQGIYRGDYVQVAKDVVLRTKDYPLYERGAGFAEHSVFYSVNIFRYPKAPVKNIGLKPVKEKDYFLFTTDNTFNSSKVAKEYILGTSRKKLYLLCCGKACV